MNLHDFYALYKKGFDKREESVRENRTLDKKVEVVEKENLKQQND